MYMYNAQNKGKGRQKKGVIDNCCLLERGNLLYCKFWIYWVDVNTPKKLITLTNERKEILQTGLS